MTTTTTDNEPNGGNTFSDMKQDSLYILLYKDGDPTVRFHWGLYHFHNPTDGGWKFDIIRPQGRWKTSIPYTKHPSPNEIDGTYGDGPLACAIRIASVPYEDRFSVHDAITADDGRLNELTDDVLGEPISCRVYVKRAFENLQCNGSQDDYTWDAVQREVLEIGEQKRDMACEGSVFVVDSQVDGLGKPWPWYT